jgi:hypothetical protein
MFVDPETEFGAAETHSTLDIIFVAGGLLHAADTIEAVRRLRDERDQLRRRNAALVLQLQRRGGADPDADSARIWARIRALDAGMDQFEAGLRENSALQARILTLLGADRPGVYEPPDDGS